MPRGCLVVGLWCSADFSSCWSYGGENKASIRKWGPDPPQWICVTRVCITLVQIMGALLTQISGSFTVFWFTSPSSYKVHKLVFFQAGLNQKWWSGNTSNVFKLLVDHGTRLQGAWNKVSWYTCCMGIEPSAVALLCFRSTPTGLCCTQMQPSYVPIQTSWALNVIDAKSVDGPCRKIQSHYLPGLLTNIRCKVMNHLFSLLKQFYFYFI